MTRRRPYLMATPLPEPERRPTRVELLIGSLIGFAVLIAACVVIPGIPA